MTRCVRASDITPGIPHPHRSKLASVHSRRPSWKDVSGTERQHPRYAVEAEVKLYLGSQVIEGRTRNVSRGGLCADLSDALPVGEDVDIDMHLVFEDSSISDALRLPARVVWCTPFENAYQIGLSFRAMNAQRSQYVALFLKYLEDDKPQKQPKAADVDDRFR